MRLKLLITAYLAVAALCWQVKLTNSRTSTLWRLNPESGKITSGGEEQYVEKAKKKNTEIGSSDAYNKDYIFYVIASTTKESDSSHTGWTRQYTENTYDSVDDYRNRNNRTLSENTKKEKLTKPTRTDENDALILDRLDCGKPANYTKYDHLIGIGMNKLNYHPLFPEPEVAYLFLGTNDEYAYRNFDLAALERRLKQRLRTKRDKNLTFQLYTDIGNYFRIIGDTRQAIECFRHAVALREHPDALLNLARILYNLEYFSDAILLSLDSINAAPKGYVPWQEYLMLGEIFKASGRIQESTFHLRRALELYPDHEPTLKLLRDVENNTMLSSVHVYTVIIIVALVVAVFVVILTNIESDFCNTNNQRIAFCTSHFGGVMRTQILTKHRAVRLNARYVRQRRF